MASSEMLRRVAFVRNDVSEELSASFIRITRIGDLGTTLAVTSNDAHTQRVKSDLFWRRCFISVNKGPRICTVASYDQMYVIWKDVGKEEVVTSFVLCEFCDY
jgi:hypothetical protein